MTSLIESEEGMKQSYAFAFLTITPLMMLLIGSVRGGLSSMIPNLAPIALVVGVMGWFDIRFDVFTIMTGSIAILFAFIADILRHSPAAGSRRLSRRTWRA